MKTIQFTLLGILMMLAAGLRAQLTVYDSPGNTITLSSRTFPGDVVVSPQTKVLIPSHVTIKMKNFSKIIVKSGGAMLEVQGKITLDDQQPQASYWGGIEVEGNVNFPQLPVSSISRGTYPGYNINANGVVFLNSASIELADIGVKSTNGGVVYGVFTNFFYCRRALFINSFPKQVVSTLDNCEILTEGNFSDVLVQQAYGLNLKDCEFINDVPGGNSNEAIAAVNIIEGGAYIQGCKFKEFLSGVIVRSFNGSFRRPISITQSIFENTNTAIRILGCDYVTIKNNNFYNNNQHAGIGTYIEGSTGFNYSGNKFYNYPSGTAVYNGVSTFKNSGSLIGNMINNNYYWNCFRPVLATDNNRGLQIKCNNFLANFSSYTGNNIVAYGFNGGTIDPNLGIPHQGAYIDNDNIGYHLAGNLFTNIGTASATDIDASLDIPDFTYFHHKKVGAARVEPMYIRSPKVGKEPSPIAASNTRDQACWLWLSENKPVTIRMNEHIEQRNQLISEDIAANKEQIKYMDQIIAHDVAEYAIDLAEAGDEEALLNFLLTNITRQKRMMLVQYYISMQNYSVATTHLSVLANDSTGSDLPHYVNYYTRLINILQANAGNIVLQALIVLTF